MRKRLTKKLRGQRIVAVTREVGEAIDEALVPWLYLPPLALTPNNAPGFTLRDAIVDIERRVIEGGIERRVIEIRVESMEGNRINMMITLKETK